MMKHLERFMNLIPLEGESYVPLKKALIYSLLGNAIKFNIIRYGSLILDTRVNLALPLKAGYGKTTCKRFIKDTINRIGRVCVEPTSLHSEQLVGKSVNIVDGSGNIVKNIINYGYLANDFVIFEEALKLIRDSAYEEARNYINIALDTIGYNEVYKRNVDTEIQNAVRFIPNCSILLLFHPIPITTEIVDRGLMRRFLICYINPTVEERLSALEIESNVSAELMDEWIRYLKELSNKTFNWSFSPKYNLIVEYTKKLIEDGYQFSQKGKELTDTMFFTLRDRILKLTIINTASQQIDVVDTVHIVEAYKDLLEFWEQQLCYVEEKIGAVGRGELRDVVMDTILGVLRENNCFDKNSGMMPKDIILKVCQRIGTSYGLTSYYFNQLRKLQVIVSDEETHKTWLVKVKPEEADIISKLKG